MIQFYNYGQTRHPFYIGLSMWRRQINSIAIVDRKCQMFDGKTLQVSLTRKSRK